MCLRTKLQFACIALIFLYSNTANASWEFAVTANSKIIFYDDNWRELTSAAHQFDQLSAIAFDETEETIYFNDQLHSNGSIFSLKLSTSSQHSQLVEKIVQSTQNESITSIAYDPVDRVLYWADRRNRKIYKRSVDASATTKAQVFLDFTDGEAIPDGIALDVCRRRLYWTNSNFKNASIESIYLNATDRQVIVTENLYLPHGIIVDQLTDRLYWVVDQEGIFFSVESAQLNGSDRTVIVRGLHNVPFSLAVDKQKIYWTDMTHNAIWSSLLHMSEVVNATDATTALPEPEKVKQFTEPPRGIALRTNFLNSLQGDAACAATVQLVRNRLLTPRPTQDYIDEQIAKLRREYCLNGGQYAAESNVCVCQLGFKGARCESSDCQNYCVYGTCGMSATGFPKCTCQRGFYGERCQWYKCMNYCFNDGACKIDMNGEPTCDCVESYGGQRCEQNVTEVCSLFCRVLKHDPDMKVPFGCHDICERLVQESDDGDSMYAIPHYTHLEVCRNMNIWDGKVIIVVVCGVVTCLVLVLFIVHGLRRYYKPARPRIKKTFVVRKQARSSPDTPLTNRPLATEQCEITIENCCNMNICDTPCFDPKLVQQTLSRDCNTKEDKKMLIDNIEEDLY